MEIFGVGTELPVERRICGVASDGLRPLKGFVSYGLEQIFERLPALGGLYTVEYVLDRISTKEMQLWVVLNKTGSCATGFIITQVVLYPKAKMLEYVFIWNKGRDDRAFMEEIFKYLQKFALEQGCTYVGGYGRKGWTRAVNKDWHELSKFITEVKVDETLH